MVAAEIWAPLGNYLYMAGGVAALVSIFYVMRSLTTFGAINIPALSFLKGGEAPAAGAGAAAGTEGGAAGAIKPTAPTLKDKAKEIGDDLKAIQKELGELRAADAKEVATTVTKLAEGVIKLRDLIKRLQHFANPTAYGAAGRATSWIAKKTYWATGADKEREDLANQTLDELRRTAIMLAETAKITAQHIIGHCNKLKPSIADIQQKASQGLTTHYVIPTPIISGTTHDVLKHTALRT
jgi:hypothetical protein